MSFNSSVNMHETIKIWCEFMTLNSLVNVEDNNTRVLFEKALSSMTPDKTRQVSDACFCLC